MKQFTTLSPALIYTVKHLHWPTPPYTATAQNSHLH